MTSCISSPGDGAFLLSEEREAKKFNERRGPKTENYPRFCILVKVFEPTAIAKSHFSTNLELRASFEARSIKKTEKRNERLLN